MAFFGTQNAAYILLGVTGFTVGKKSTTLMKRTQTMATQLITRPYFPSVNGPSMNFTCFSYTILAKMTAMYDKSSAGAVMEKIATTDCVDPIPMQLSKMANSTTSHTALTGVCV